MRFVILRMLKELASSVQVCLLFVFSPKGRKDQNKIFNKWDKGWKWKVGALAEILAIYTKVLTEMNNTFYVILHNAYVEETENRALSRFCVSRFCNNSDGYVTLM